MEVVKWGMPRIGTAPTLTKQVSMAPRREREVGEGDGGIARRNLGRMQGKGGVRGKMSLKLIGIALPAWTITG